MLRGAERAAPTCPPDRRAFANAAVFKADHESGEIRLYNFANPDVEGMLIGHIVNDDLVWVTDMYSPARDQRKTPGAEQLAIKPARLAGGHGGDCELRGV
jgi:hypothetical protein